MALLSLGLVWFGLAGAPSVSWISQAGSEVILGCGLYLVWVTATVYIQDLYVSHANSALAACALLRYSAGAASPLLSGFLSETLGSRRTMLSLGIMCALLIPFHAVFYFWGRQIRGWSKFALHEG
jgi:fucose permease